MKQHDFPVFLRPKRNAFAGTGTEHTFFPRTNSIYFLLGSCSKSFFCFEMCFVSKDCSDHLPGFANFWFIFVVLLALSKIQDRPSKVFFSIDEVIFGIC